MYFDIYHFFYTECTTQRNVLNMKCTESYVEKFNLFQFTYSRKLLKFIGKQNKVLTAFINIVTLKFITQFLKDALKYTKLFKHLLFCNMVF